MQNNIILTDDHYQISAAPKLKAYEIKFDQFEM